jgi:regulatory protein
MPARRLSLKARALQLLAQREHSRTELRRKLLAHARAVCVARTDGDAGVPAAADDDDPGPCLDKLLDWLEAHRYLSAPRFIESRVHARAPRFGHLRIRQELAQHGLEPDPALMQSLKATEFERARAVWARKFDGPADEPAARARQMRFLAGRGFSMDVIRRVVKGAGGEED